jgi:hypothetical protein
MMTLQKREAPTGDIPDMTHDELDSEWRKAKACFDQALIQKTEADRSYVAAAIRLNTLDRLVKKVEQRAAVARREAAKSLVRTAQMEVQISGK